MWMKHPQMAKEWAAKTPSIKALPQHVKPKPVKRKAGRKLDEHETYIRKTLGMK